MDIETPVTELIPVERDGYLFVHNFIKDPVIESLAKNQRWTFTGTNDGKKKPMDIVEFVRTDGRICRGASPKYKTSSYMTLEEIADDPVLDIWLGNVCYDLNQMYDDVVILDVEPGCPEEDKRKLLQLPWIYGETSLSGKGLHLVFPAPASYPKVRYDKDAIKLGKRKDFEILLNHKVTFTKRPITRDPNEPIRPMSDFEALWEKCAKRARLTKYASLDVSKLPPVDTIPHWDDIQDGLSTVRIDKNPDDYRHKNGTPDMSKYDWAVGQRYKTALNRLLACEPFRDHKYTTEEKIAILYEYVRASIPHRPKHDEIIHGIPKLLNTCKKIMTEKRDA